MSEELRYQLEEFKEMRHKAFVAAYELNSEGKHIAGIYGVNVPREIFWAMDIVPVNVFGIDGSNIREAEKYMDEKDCSLLKASFGYVITDRCPFSHFASIIVGADCCPERECMMHNLEDIKDVYIINEHGDINELEQEYRRFIEFLEHKFNVGFDEKKLSSIVEKTNEENKLIEEITHIYMSYPSIMGGHDLKSVIYGSRFIFDLDLRLDSLNRLKEAMKESLPRQYKNLAAKRILIAGAPMEGMAEEILKPLSYMNHGIISLSYCEGESYKSVSNCNNLLLGLAQKYASEDFPQKLKCIVKRYNIDAVINLKFSGCNFQDESCGVLGLPYYEAEVGYCNNYDKVLEVVKSFISRL